MKTHKQGILFGVKLGKINWFTNQMHVKKWFLYLFFSSVCWQAKQRMPDIIQPVGNKPFSLLGI
ncbi:hypothetical protein C7N43_09915 [Sphingobacteriales bacterium UPWRP_1]|nr:hypothetical protein B6N25_12025 [Sphingobacteriales bacterium TSM_CSS]PSJ77248.1 hypothetical protein C7N43_09915 [Sphingobacteriales bacterium UPWRP_1]